MRENGISWGREGQEIRQAEIVSTQQTSQEQNMEIGTETDRQTDGGGDELNINDAAETVRALT